MSRTPMHQAVVTLPSRLVNGEMKTMFRIGKIASGQGDYAMETDSPVNAYYCAMEMTRDNGARVFISQETADYFKKCGCSVQDEWTIVADPIKHFNLR